MPMQTRLRSGRGKRVNYAQLAGKKARAAPARVMKSVKKYVRSAIKRNTETKMVTSQVIGSVLFNSGIGAADQYRALPYVTQGPTDHNRIGDKIKPVGLYVRGQVSMIPTPPTNKPIMVRIAVLQLKSAHYWPQAQAGWASGAYAVLLKKNDESGTENVAYTGAQDNNFLPINRDAFDVLGERFIKLEGQPEGSVEAATPGTVSRTVNFKLRKVPKTLGYSGSANQYPENFSPFIVIGYTYMDGTIPDVAATNLIATMSTHLYFKDA